MISIACLIIGLLPIVKGMRDRQNIAFSILCFMAGIWTLSNFFGSNLSNVPVVRILVAIDFISGLLLVNAFWAFAYLTKSKFLAKRFNKKIITSSIIMSAIVSLLIIFGQVIRVDYKEGLLILNQPLYPIYLLAAGLYMVMGIKELIVARIKSRGIYRKQVSIMLVGLVLAALMVAIPNLVLANIFARSSLLLLAYDLAYVGIFFFLVLSAYAIVKHKLFDIRSVIARSVVYLLLLPLLVTVYSLLVFGLTSLMFDDAQKVELSQQIIYIFTAIFMSLTYQKVKTFFDQLTNRLFFRDAYDSQTVLDKVSSVIVGSVDPHKVQKGSLSAIFESLHPSYATFVLIDAADKLRRGDLIGQQWAMHDPVMLRSVLKKLGKNITNYDELDEHDSQVKTVLRTEDINIVAPLVTKDEHIGYLILGSKKSGNVYNAQDIGVLNIASNELAVALQNAQRFEEIQAFNITLQEKVNEATRELKRTNRKLVALDEAKDEFISMASHQLRTPLTSIKGYISMMMEGDLGKLNAQQEKALKEAFGSSQRMVYLIADFLNVSRIKTGKFVIEPKEVDLPQIVTEEITQLREMAGSRDITLKYEEPVDFPRVKLDDNKIRQVMMNMVDNAIYYTPAGGKVTIQLYVDGSDVVFKVIDTGIGVPKHEQHKLFTKFFRANNARKARPDGTGLGLFMAQKVIVEQGGTMIFESKEGEGSTFGFRFPLAKIKS